MHTIFKTVLILSLFGFGITAILLILKPVTSKKFPARWQYFVWIAVMLSMLVPIYKFIPEKQVQKLTYIPQISVIQNEEYEENVPLITEKPSKEEPTEPSENRINFFDIVPYIWFFGMCIYLVFVISSYILYVVRNNKKAVKVTDSSLLLEVKKELGIKRNIKIKTLGEIHSPMLAGVFFPTIYIPCKEIPNENMRMIFLHELTHYKRCDLFIKWLAVFVNAVHWFNPLAYLLCINVGEACEVSCDMEVTKNMTEQEQKLYMKTILDLIEK